MWYNEQHNTRNEEGLTMPYCPECKTDYKEKVMICSKCNVDLLPGLVPTQERGAVDWYEVQSVPNEVAGYILKSVLEDEGIEVFYAQMKYLVMVV